MTVEAFYTAMDTEYSMVLRTYQSESRIRRYLKMYLEDKSYQELCEAVERQDCAAAFEAAHAMKGTVGMLYLQRLYRAVCDLVEQVRPLNVPIDSALFERVRVEQSLVIEGIQQI